VNFVRTGAVMAHVSDQIEANASRLRRVGLGPMLAARALARHCFQLQGLLGDKARDWRGQIIKASALIEAGIDFSDEGDVPTELIAPALAMDRTRARHDPRQPGAVRSSRGRAA